MKIQLDIWLNDEDIKHLEKGGTVQLKTRESNIVNINKEEMLK